MTSNLGAQFPVVDLRDHRIVNDGVTDQTAQILAVVNAAGGTYTIPPNVLFDRAALLAGLNPNVVIIDMSSKIAYRFAWLIERMSNKAWPMWRSLTSNKPEAGWTTDANEALQFSRKKDAEDFMAADDGDGEIYSAQAIEHGFHEGPA